MADVELQEQTVPLKSAEHGAEGAETAAGAEGQQQQEQTDATAPNEPKSKEKKGWFSKKKTTKTEVVTVTASSDKPPAEGDAAAAEGGGEAGAVNNVNDKKQKGGAAKKCPFLFARSKKCGECGAGGEQQQADAVQHENQPSFQFNMVQRDDRKLQEAIDLGVENIFGEPDAVHSVNGVWKATLVVFLAVRNFIYKLLSLVFAIPLAVVFGVLFGLFSVLSVYVFVPVGRLLSIPFSWLAKVWSVVVSAVLDPICRSCGLIFGGVKISRYGINQDPTAVLTA